MSVSAIQRVPEQQPVQPPPVVAEPMQALEVAPAALPLPPPPLPSAHPAVVNQIQQHSRDQFLAATQQPDFKKRLLAAKNLIKDDKHEALNLLPGDIASLLKTVLDDEGQEAIPQEAMSYIDRISDLLKDLKAKEEELRVQEERKNDMNWVTNKLIQEAREIGQIRVVGPVLAEKKRYAITCLVSNFSEYDLKAQLKMIRAVTDDLKDFGLNDLAFKIINELREQILSDDSQENEKAESLQYLTDLGRMFLFL
jgi:hypothetical protein